MHVHTVHPCQSDSVQVHRLPTVYAFLGRTCIWRGEGGGGGGLHHSPHAFHAGKLVTLAMRTRETHNYLILVLLGLWGLLLRICDCIDQTGHPRPTLPTRSGKHLVTLGSLGMIQCCLGRLGAGTVYFDWSDISVGLIDQRLQPVGLHITHTHTHTRITHTSHIHTYIHMTHTSHTAHIPCITHIHPHIHTNTHPHIHTNTHPHTHTNTHPHTHTFVVIHPIVA